MLSIDLSGKKALVTGATGQLGRVISRTLGRAGADVAICYQKNYDMANRLQHEIAAEYGVKTIAVEADIRSLDSVLKMREALQKDFGMPDILVNCAVSPCTWEPILNQTVEMYQDQFETTVLHHVIMIKAFVPAMVEKGYGRVIGLNTECAMQCFPGQSAYAAGKRGMDAVYRTLVRELGASGVTVNQIAPGWMISDQERENGNADTDGTYTAKVPLGHRGEDQNIADAVAFLASDMAKFITGVYLPVAGGNVMPCI